MRSANKRAPVLGVSAIFFAIVCALSVFSAIAEAAPTISGSPATTVRLNAVYSFTPTARDSGSSTALRYSIINKPWWADFNVNTGRLRGTATTAGTWGNIKISVQSSTGWASLAPFAITASTSGGSSGTTNRPPVVSGTPATSVTANSAYSFRPTGSDPEGRTLTWTINSIPSWASFSTTSGVLSGTPDASEVGTYSNLVISASDGTNRTSLPAFAVTVRAAGSSTGSATLSWTPPTRNTNGSTLSNLAGYRVYYGTSSSNLSRTVQLSNAGLTRYVVNDLAPGTWYFAIRAYTASGGESTNSNTASKVIR